MEDPNVRFVARLTLKVVVMAAVIATGPWPATAGVIYVKADADGAGDGTTGGADDGTSWADAFIELQSALAVAEDGDEIWVAAGTYRPDFDPATGEHTGDRTATFQLKSGVSLYGGFAGTETTLEDRAGLFDQTILTGDLNGNDAPLPDPNAPGDPSDRRDAPDMLLPDDIEALLTDPTRGENAYHVVTGSGTDETALLDGFTVTAGQANGEFANDGGAGMLNDFGSPTVRNCTFHTNAARFGAGMLTREGTPILKRCTFESNFAGSAGGGAHMEAAAPTLDSCVFSENAALFGGGMSNVGGSTSKLTACALERNSAARGGAIITFNGSVVVLAGCALESNVGYAHGGAIYSEAGSSATLTGSALRRNSASSGGAIYAILGGITALTSCTLTGNTASTEGGAIFVDAATVTLTDSIIRRNKAETAGGGMWVLSAYPVRLTRCRFIENSAPIGAGLLNRSVTATVVDCMFLGNTGPAMRHINVDAAAIVNCLFVGNGQGVATTNHSFAKFTNCTFTRTGTALPTSDSSEAILTNCIVWVDHITPDSPESITARYSCIKGGYPGEGNIDADPLFVREPDLSNEDFGDLRLRPGSPCIDAGTNDVDVDPFFEEGTQPLPASDLVGNPRFLDDPGTPNSGNGEAPIVDMGAFEFVLPGDSDFDYDVDLADYLFLLRCMKGPGAAFDQGCHPADTDFDGDVDLADVIQAQVLFTGSR